MNPRSRRYFDRRKADSGAKKGSANIGGYNEQNQENYREPKENPAPSKTQDEDQSYMQASAGQDDTGGGNNSGKRQDPH